MTRTTNDVEAIYESLAWGAARLIADGLVIVGTLIMMFVLDWRLTLVSFALSPIIVLVVNYFRKRLRALFLEIRKSLSKLNGFFAEQINGMDIIQMNAGQARHVRNFGVVPIITSDFFARRIGGTQDSTPLWTE